MNRTRSPKWSLVVLVLACPLFLCLTQCSSSAVSATCGSIACTSNPTCTLPANLPVCAETLSAKCFTGTGECVYKLKTDSLCPCIERDVRLCNIGATPGVQICTANPARTSTSWAACAACATCT